MKNIVGILLLLTVSLNVHASLNVSDRTVQVDSLLKQAIELSERKEYVHAFQMLEELKELAEQKDDAELLFWCYTNWGINQSETMNYDDALDAFFKAYELATTKLDKRKEMSITNILPDFILEWASCRRQRSSICVIINMRRSLAIQS